MAIAYRQGFDRVDISLLSRKFSRSLITIRLDGSADAAAEKLGLAVSQLHKVLLEAPNQIQPTPEAAEAVLDRWLQLQTSGLEAALLDYPAVSLGVRDWGQQVADESEYLNHRQI